MPVRVKQIHEKSSVLESAEVSRKIQAQKSRFKKWKSKCKYVRDRFHVKFEAVEPFQQSQRVMLFSNSCSTQTLANFSNNLSTISTSISKPKSFKITSNSIVLSKHLFTIFFCKIGGNI